MDLLGLIKAHPCDVEDWLKERDIDTLEDAFRLSFLKWLYIDYIERHYSEDTSIRFYTKVLGQLWTTCGLCKYARKKLDEYFDKLLYADPCKFCPIGRDHPKDACFSEWELWYYGELPAIAVYSRIAEEYEYYLRRGTVKPFGEDEL